MAKVVWGIELGTSSIKAVKVQSQKDALEITDLCVIDLPPVDDELEQTHEERLSAALQQFKAEKGYKKEPVFISIPGHQSLNRSMTLPFLDPKKFRETVQFEAQNQMPISMDDINWDYQLVDKKFKIGDEVQVALFAVRKEIVQTYVALMDAVGMMLTGIQVAPLAIYNFVKLDQKFPKQGVVVDIGADNTDVIVIDEGRVWIRNVPSGGNAITKVLAERFKIPFDEAEKLKIKAAKSKQAEKIFSVMKPAMRELLTEINRSLGYYKSQNPKVKVNHMLMMGSGSHLLGLKKFFEQQLQFPVNKLQHLNKMQLGRTANPETLQNNIATLAVSLGLAVQGADLADNTINLIPQQKKTEETANKKFPIVLVASIILALSAIFPMLAVSGKEEEAKKAADRLRAATTAVQKNKADFDAIRPIEPVMAELSRFTTAVAGAGILSNIAEEALMRAINAPELVQEISRYNSGSKLFTGDMFDQVSSSMKMDGVIDRAEFSQELLDAIYTYKLNFDDFDTDRNGTLDRNEAEAIRLPVTRTQPVFLRLGPLDARNFPSMAFARGTQFHAIDDDPARVMVGPTGTGRPGGPMQPVAAGGATDPTADYRGFYRNRSYGAQMNLAIPIDKDPRGTAVHEHMANIQRILKDVVTKELDRLLSKYPNVIYEVESSITLNDRNPAHLPALVGQQQPRGAVSYPVAMFRPVAVAARLTYRDAHIGRVDTAASNNSRIVARFPATVLARFDELAAQDVKLAELEVLLVAGPGAPVRLKLAMSGDRPQHTKLNDREVRLEFVPDGPLQMPQMDAQNPPRVCIPQF